MIRGTKNKKKNVVSPSIRTASFYGFLSASDYIKDFFITKKDCLKSRGVQTHKHHSHVEEKIALTRMFIEKKMTGLPQPIMIFYKSPMKYEDKSHIGEHATPAFSLDIIGNPKSIADAMMIETTYVISKEEYEESDVVVEINTLGDKESLTRLKRELGSFYRKNWSKVPTILRPLYKKDIFESFRTKDKKAISLRENGPSPIGCLSEQSAKHFKEVLEYIESLSIPYSINQHLIGDISYGGELVFEVKAQDKKTKIKKIVAEGQRYNGVARGFFGKKEVSSIGASIHLKNDSFECKKNENEGKHNLFFIQLGFEAKLKSLKVLEMLRKAKLNAYQSLSKDKMTVQIGMAEKMNIPYVIIMGKKEAMENTVLVRNSNTRCQDTVPLDELVTYIKKLK